MRLALALLLGLIARPSLAGDGSIRWRTLRAPGIEVHYPSALEPLARRAVVAFADARRTLGPLFNTQPDEPLQLTIDDFADSANGYATPLPYDHVHLQAYPPEPGGDLGDHGDWLRALLFHEYAHILHLSDVSGLPALGNEIFGRRFLPNLLLPRLFVEGLAVYIETRHTGADVAVAGQGGRIDSPAYLAYLRAASLDGTLPGLEDLTGTPLRWPRGNGWYLYGSLLLDDIARTRGHAAIRRFMADYGRRVIAFGVQGVSREAFGASLSRLWQDATDRLRARVRRETLAAARADPAGELNLPNLEVEGDGQRLTHDGEWRGRVRAWPDGRSVVVAHAPRDAFARIERIDIETGRAEVLHRCALDCDEPMITADGRWLLFTESRRVRRLYLVREIMAVPLELGQGAPALRLTHGLRGRAPSIDPSGHWLLSVAIRDARTELHLLDLPAALAAAQGGATTATRRIGPAPAIGDVLSSPVLTADGRLLWTRGNGNGRSIWSAPFEPRALRLGAPRRLEAAAWVRGDDPLLRGDLRNAAAIEVPWADDLELFGCGDHACLGAVVQTALYRDAADFDLGAPEAGWHLRTRTLTGITSATHAGGRVISVRHGGTGLDLYAAPQAGGQEPLLATAALSLPATPTTTAPYEPPAAHAASSDYDPLPTLRPRAWSPIFVATGDNPDLLRGGLWLGAMTTGQDALDHWELQLSGQLRSSGKDPVFYASLRALRWEPIWDLGGGYQQGTAWFRRGFRWQQTATDRLGLRLGGNWTLPGLRDAWTFSAAYRVVRSSLRNPYLVSSVQQEPDGPVPYGPWTGLDALIDLGLGYGYGESYPDSIGTERLHTASVHASYGDRWTGGGRQRLAIDLGTAHHWPLGSRRILALDGNLSLVPIGQEFGPSYGIRGVLPFHPMDLLSGGAGGGAVVRGAAAGPEVLGGNGLGWGSAALHLPVRDIGRGVEVLPVYAGRLTFVGFCDWAWAFWTPAGYGLRSGGMLSLGGELRVDYDLGYIPMGVLRLGLAHALGDLGGTQGYVTVGL